jgi:hypothetical protein
MRINIIEFLSMVNSRRPASLQTFLIDVSPRPRPALSLPFTFPHPIPNILGVLILEPPPSDFAFRPPEQWIRKHNRAVRISRMRSWYRSWHFLLIDFRMRRSIRKPRPLFALETDLLALPGLRGPRPTPSLDLMNSLVNDLSLPLEFLQLRLILELINIALVGVPI